MATTQKNDQTSAQRPENKDDRTNVTTQQGKGRQEAGGQLPVEQPKGEGKPSGLERQRDYGQRGLSRGYGGGYGGSPFGLMRRFMDDIDRMFTGSLGMSQLSPFGGTNESMWSPQVEVLRRGDKLVVRADLPGLTPDDVNVEIDGDVLTISGERKYENEEEKGGVWHSERSYGSFSRSIALPQGVDPQSVNAKYEGGVLEIELPDTQKIQSGKTIPIQGSKSK